MVRAFRADRVGGVGIAGEQEGLAAAAAEVFFFFVAVAAGLFHPAGAAVVVEAFGLVPDFPKAAVADVREAQAGQHAGGVAR